MKIIQNFAWVLVLAVAHATSSFSQDIPIAVAVPITGDEAPFGGQILNGAQQAIADINAAGGLFGKNLVMQPFDDGCDPEKARSVAARIVEMKAPVVIGHYCSDASIQASKIYSEGNVLQISPATTNNFFTDQDLWNTFRVSGRDDKQGAKAASFIIKNYKDKNIAIVHDGTTYGQGLADKLQEALNSEGVREKLFEFSYRGGKDFSELVAKLKKNAIDIVYVGGYHQQAGLILRQMREQGMKTMLMSGDAIAGKEFATTAGLASSDGALFTFGQDPRRNPTAAPVSARFKAMGIDPEGYTLYTYAALQTWIAAVNRIGTLDPKKVAETMRGADMKGTGRGPIWDTVLGPLSFDRKGDNRAANWMVYRWDRFGNYVELDSDERN